MLCANNPSDGPGAPCPRPRFGIDDALAFASSLLDAVPPLFWLVFVFLAVVFILCRLCAPDERAHQRNPAWQDYHRERAYRPSLSPPRTAPPHVPAAHRQPGAIGFYVPPARHKPSAYDFLVAYDNAAGAQAHANGKWSGRCNHCGADVSYSWMKCYPCNQAFQRAGLHDQEYVDGLAERDARNGRKAFWVYVLATDYGHYVGHTGNPRARLAAHSRGHAPSTAGGNPKFIWKSSHFKTRERAAAFETTMKFWRDNTLVSRFAQTTGIKPIPFWRQ